MNILARAFDEERRYFLHTAHPFGYRDDIGKRRGDASPIPADRVLRVRAGFEFIEPFLPLRRRNKPRCTRSGHVLIGGECLAPDGLSASPIAAEEFSNERGVL